MTRSAHHYALLSRQVYQGDKLVPGAPVGFGGWTVCRSITGSCGYFSAIFLNQRRRQLVLAHRGTNSVGALLTDIKGVVGHHYTQQQAASISATEEAVQMAKNIGFSLVFTGHSLGAWHAEQSLVYANIVLGESDCQAVTFESPGSYEMLSKFFATNLRSGAHDLHHLNVIEYLSYPNLINTFNHHVGTLIHVQPFLAEMGSCRLHHTRESHSIDAIVEALSDVSVTCCYMGDWPLGLQYLSAKPNQGGAVGPLFQSHFRVETQVDPNYDLPLHHLAQDQAELLLESDERFQLSGASEQQKDELRQAWQARAISPSFVSLMLGYRIQQYHHLPWLQVNGKGGGLDAFQHRLAHSAEDAREFQSQCLRGVALTQ